jgi:adenine-specific DNA-methyltransferase
LGLQKGKHSSRDFFLRIHKDRYVDVRNEKTNLNLNLLALLSKKYLVIPLISQKEIDVVSKIYANSSLFEEIGHCFTGEVDLTLGKQYLTQNTKDAIMLKGAIIEKFLIRKEMSQGEIMFLDSRRFLAENSGEKTHHHRKSRIVMQGITGVNEKIRLKSTIANAGTFCGNSVNYIVINDNIQDLPFVMAILNSKISNFVFTKFSTNSNVNGHEVDNLPYPRNVDEKTKQIIAKIALDICALKNANTLANTSELEYQIDQLVYQLYGLTPEEIAIVEGKIG